MSEQEKGPGIPAEKPGDEANSSREDAAAEAEAQAEEAEAAEVSTEPAGSDAVPAGWYPDPQRVGNQRYWDGAAWGQTMAAGSGPAGALPSLSTEPKSSQQRRLILAQQIQFAAARGRRIESQSEYQAVLVSGQPINHVLHAILTIFTCLLWGIVWAIIAATGGEKREMIVVDEFGNVQHTSLGKA